MITEMETGFGDANCASSALNDVLLVGSVLGIEKSFEIGKIVVQAVWGEGERSERERRTGARV